MTESTNPHASGSDTAQSSISIDDAMNIDFYDPGEENKKEDVAEQSQPDLDEKTEDDVAEEQEVEQPVDDKTEDEAQEADDEAVKPEPTDDVTVTVNGEQIALSDLKSSYMRQADYTRKTQELSNQRRDLEAMATSVTHNVNAIADFLIKQLPPEPNSALLHTDPVAYVQQRELRQLAEQQLSSLFNNADQVVEAKQAIDVNAHQQRLANEKAKLVESFPSAATKEGWDKFFNESSGAAKELGFSDEEIGAETDHRMFKLAYYAKIGMQAEKAKAKAFKKVENVPPVAPLKRQASRDAAQFQKNRDAIKRLNKTGSIHDAMAIDFD